MSVSLTVPGTRFAAVPMGSALFVSLRVVLPCVPCLCLCLCLVSPLLDFLSQKVLKSCPLASTLVSGQHPGLTARCAREWRVRASSHP